MSTVQVSKLATLTGHRDCVYTVVPSAESSIIFSAGGDGMIVQWDLIAPEEGNLIAKLPNSVYAIHYLEKNDLIVAGHNYEGVHLLDWRSKKEIASLKIATGAIFDIQSHENNLFVSSAEGLVSVIDISQWSIKRKLVTSDKSARCIAINIAVGEFAVGYSDRMIRIFSLNDFQLIRQFKAHDNSVFTLRYSLDSNFLISGSRDARLKIWDVRADYKQVEEIVAHLFAINHISFSPSGSYFITGSMDKSIKLWDTHALKLLKVIDKTRHAGHGTSVNKLLWTSFNDEIVSASDDRTLSVWKLKMDT
jgi:WD40 repeat protein